MRLAFTGPFRFDKRSVARTGVHLARRFGARATGKMHAS